MFKLQSFEEQEAAPPGTASLDASCAVSLAEISAAFDPPGSPAPALAASSTARASQHPQNCQFPPPSSSSAPLGALASWRSNPSFASAERLSLHSLRHRLH